MLQLQRNNTMRPTSVNRGWGMKLVCRRTVQGLGAGKVRVASGSNSDGCGILRTLCANALYTTPLSIWCRYQRLWRTIMAL